jgi:hypothetical protein
MQLNKGFIGLGVVLVILFGLIVVGSGAYYVVHKNEVAKAAMDAALQTQQEAVSKQSMSEQEDFPYIDGDAVVYRLHSNSGAVYTLVTVAGADAKTFSKISGNLNPVTNNGKGEVGHTLAYYHDKDKVYLFQIRVDMNGQEKSMDAIADADASTFVVDSATTVHDKNRSYTVSWQCVATDCKWAPSVFQEYMSGWKTYVNAPSGYAIKYPESDQPSATTSDFTIQVSAPDVNEGPMALSVSTNMDTSNCLATPTDPYGELGVKDRGTVNIQGVAFHSYTEDTVATGNFHSRAVYSTVHNGKCFLLQVSSQGYDPSRLPTAEEREKAQATVTLLADIAKSIVSSFYFTR